MFPQSLENEAIHIMREVAVQFERPVILFSGGKDSLTLIHLAHKAFWPARIPFKVVHIDTGHNFPETLAFRDETAIKYKLDLLIGKVQTDIDNGVVVDEKGDMPSRNALQTTTLLRSIKAMNADACIGGARRDEEKARAKERIFSVRQSSGGWDIKNQRPEVWNIYNGAISPNQNVRVFPLSNWTELDVWNYIRREGISLPSIYYAHKRKVFEHNGVLMPVSPFWKIDSSVVFETKVRFRTVGDMTCTAALLSEADNLDAIIEEISHSNYSERGARMDDKRSATAMEDRKRKGYF